MIYENQFTFQVERFVTSEYIQGKCQRGKTTSSMIWSYFEKAAAAAAKSLQSCADSVWPHRGQPTRLLCPWDSLGKNTAVGCHFLLQCMKVKSESEVAQSFLTLSDPMDCSPPGSSVHGIFQARVLEWVAIAFFSVCAIKGHNYIYSDQI